MQLSNALNQRKDPVIETTTSTVEKFPSSRKIPLTSPTGVAQFNWMRKWREEIREDITTG